MLDLMAEIYQKMGVYRDGTFVESCLIYFLAEEFAEQSLRVALLNGLDLRAEVSLAITRITVTFQEFSN